MSNIVSLFAPPSGAKEQVSGSSEKKVLKPLPLTGEEPVSTEEAISGKPLRKKKTSFMDHLLFHGESLPAPVLQTPVSPVSETVSKGTIEKAPVPSVVTSGSGEKLKKSISSSISPTSFILPAKTVSGKKRKSELVPTKEMASEDFSSIAAARPPSGTRKKTDELAVGPPLESPVTGPSVQVGDTHPASRASVKVGDARPSSGRFQGAVPAGAAPTQFPVPPEEASLSGLERQAPKETPNRSGEKRKVLLPDDGQKVISEPSRLKVARLEGEHLKPQDFISREPSKGDSFPEKELRRESPILSEHKPIVSSPGESSLSDQATGENGSSYGFSDDKGKPSEAKNSQSAPSAAPVSTALPLTAPESLSTAALERPSIDQREMVSKVVDRARHGGGEISLRVHPPALGPIRIQVHVDPRTREVEVKLFARDESVGDLLRSKSQELKGALSREGFTMHQFHVDGGSGDLPASTPTQTAFSGPTQGGDSSSGSSQGFPQGGSGPFGSQGSGGSSLNLTQGGDGSRGRAPETPEPVPGMAVSQSPSFQPPDRSSSGDLSGFYRVV